MKYKFLPHTADIKFQAFGKTIEEAFENSALAMLSDIYNKKIKETKKIKIKVKGQDFESLLYNFLEEFLFLLDSKRFLVSKVKKIKIDKKNFKLEAEISGDDAKNYGFTNTVKAITYNSMFIKNKNKKWVTQVVLDV
ncbi:MAG: archease [Nanoarchaeota archaeon]